MRLDNCLNFCICTSIVIMSVGIEINKSDLCCLFFIFIVSSHDGMNILLVMDHE